MPQEPLDPILQFVNAPKARNRTRVGDLIDFWADKHGVPRDLAHTIADKESGKNPDVRRSKKGAIGPMQIMPGTAKYLGINPFNLDQNVEGGVRYLKEQLDEFKGDHVLAAAAYNAGPGNVKKAGNRVPNIPETQNYVKGIEEPQQPAQTPDDDPILKFVNGPHTKVVVGKSVPAEFTGEDVPDRPAADQKFNAWYSEHAKRHNLNPNPDDPRHRYDYRAAFNAGAEPDETGHWPSQFKAPDHPNRFVMQGGVPLDSISGQPATEEQLAAMTPEQRKVFAVTTAPAAPIVQGEQAQPVEQPAAPQVNVQELRRNDEVESYRAWYDSFQSMQKKQNAGEDAVKDWQAALDTGRELLAKFPNSQYAPHIKRFLDKASQDSVTINLNDFKREDRTPTVEDIRQRVARALGFTKRERKAFEEEARYFSQQGHQPLEKGLHPDGAAPGTNPFYEARDEAGAIKSIMSRVDDAGQVALPALTQQSLSTARGWLTAYRANKKAVQQNEDLQAHLEYLRNLNPKFREEEARDIAKVRELLPEEREALRLDAPKGAESWIQARIRQGFYDFGSGASRVVGQGMEYYGAVVQQFAEPSQLIKDVFGVNVDPRLLAPVRGWMGVQGFMVGKWLEERGATISGQADVASRAGGLKPGMAKDVVSGAGSSLPFLALGGLPGTVGKIAVGLMGWATQAGQVYDEARQAGLSTHDALMAAHAGGPAGLLEMWGIGGTLDRVGRHVLAENFIRAALRESGEEATQEMVQQVLGNLVAKGFYDKKRDVFQGVGYSGLIAAIVGGGMGGGTHAVASGVEYVGDMRTVRNYEAKMASGEAFEAGPQQAQGANLEWGGSGQVSIKDPEAFQEYRDAVARLAARKAGIKADADEEEGSLSVVPGRESQVTGPESQVTEEPATTPVTAEEAGGIQEDTNIPNLAERYPDLFPETGPSAERGEPSKPKAEPRKPVLENIDGTNRHVVRSEDGRVGIVQIGASGNVEFSEVRNPKSAKRYEGLGGLIPSTEFDSLFPRNRGAGYQPGAIEEARARFAKDEGLGSGSTVKGHETPIVKGESVPGQQAAPAATAAKTQASTGKEIANSEIPQGRNLTERVKSMVRPEGHLSRGMPYVAGLIKGDTDEEVISLLRYTKSDEATPWVERFVGSEAAAELRRRGVPVDEASWQKENLGKRHKPLKPLRRFNHKQFGLLVEDADQRGVPVHHVRTVDTKGDRHTIRDPKGPGGNTSASQDKTNKDDQGPPPPPSAAPKTPVVRKTALQLQAESTLKVHEEMLSTGKWPNGKTLTDAQRAQIETENEEWRKILAGQEGPTVTPPEAKPLSKADELRKRLADRKNGKDKSNDTKTETPVETKNQEGRSPTPEAGPQIPEAPPKVETAAEKRQRMAEELRRKLSGKKGEASEERAPKGWGKVEAGEEKDSSIGEPQFTWRKKPGKAGRLYMNPAGARLLNLVRTGSTRPTHGVAFSSELAQVYAREAVQMAGVLPRATKKGRAKQAALKNLAKVLRQAANDETEIVAIVNRGMPGRKTIRHEEIHRTQQLINRVFGHWLHEGLVEQLPHYEKIAAALKTFGYPDNITVLGMEAAAHIGAGQAEEKLGLTDEEAFQFLKGYFTLVADTHGEAAVALFQEIAPRYKEVRDEIRDRAKEGSQGSREGARPTAGDVRTVEEGRGRGSPEGSRKGKGTPQEEIAWHGSPYTFDKFTLDHIGTGEGAQSYGWGLYFAGKEAVGRFYREKLSPSRHPAETPRFTALTSEENDRLSDTSRERIVGMRGTHIHGVRFTSDPKGFGTYAINQIIEDYEARLALPTLTPEQFGYREASLATKPLTSEQATYFEEQIRILKKLRDSGDYSEVKKGRLYKVDLAPKESDYLLWDKPLSEQSVKVRKALQDGGVTHDEHGGMPPNTRGQAIYQSLKDEAGTRPLTEWAERTGLNRHLDRPEAASRFLLSLGVRGIKYLDAGSRSRGAGSYNYVIFDDADIAIQAMEDRGDTNVDDIAAVKEAFRRYDEEGDLSIDDFVSEIDNLAQDSNDAALAAKLGDAVDAYRSDASEDRAKWGMRGDADARENAFVDAVSRAIQSAPTALADLADTKAEYDAVKLDPDVKDLLLEISKSFIDEGNTDLDELITSFEGLLGDEFDKVADDLPTILAYAEDLASQPKAPPEKIDLTPKTPTTLGKTSRVKTSTGIEARTQFALVEVGDPIASHGMDMHPNPHFPQGVQNRDRTRIGSEQHILDMIRKFEPEYLGKNIDAGNGAPIVGPDMAVESGNGRTIMLRRIYREYPERATQYKEWLRENSEDFGFTPDQVDALQNPMLVQVRTTAFSGAERIAFAESANADTKLQMSPVEIALQDGRRLGSSMMSIFYPDQEGNIDTAANRPFISAFLDQIAGPDKGKLITEDGLLSQAGDIRIRNAIFAKAYADTDEGARVLSMLAETKDDNIKRTIAAMTFQASHFAKLKEDIAAGARYPLDLAPDLAIAARHLSLFRKSGHTIEDYLAQLGLFGDKMDKLQKKIFWVLNEKKGTAKGLNEILTRYLAGAEEMGDPRQPAIFSGQAAPVLTKEELFEAAVKEAKYGEGEQGGLFGGTQAEAIGGEKSPLFEDQAPPVGDGAAPAGESSVVRPPTDTPIPEEASGDSPVGEAPTEVVEEPPVVAPIEQPVEPVAPPVKPPKAAGGGGGGGGTRTPTTKPPKKRKTKASQQDVSDEPESGEAPGRDDLGGDDGDSAPRQSGRIITARSHLTKRGDESLVPRRLLEFLEPHQIQGVAVALEAMSKSDNSMFNGGFLLADGTGAGKTRQILAVASTYAEQGHPVLIIAPNETLKPVWKEGRVTGSYHYDAKAMGIPYTLAQGKGTVSKGGITVTTYHRFHELDIDPGTILILDEGHALKNADSQRAKKGMQLIRKAEAILFATATPQDKPTHLEYLARAGILENKSLEQAMKDLGLIRGKSADGQSTIWKINPKVGQEKVIKRIEKLFDRMTNRGQMIKRELSMEGVKITFHRVSLPPEAKATMDAIDKGFGGLKNAPAMRKALILMHMRRQQETFKIDLVAKRVKQAIDAGRRPIVYLSRINYSEAGRDIYQFVGGVRVKVGRQVFASSEGTAPLLKAALKKYGITNVAELHGGAEEKGSDAVAAFQKGNAQAMIATIESGGTGINLDDIVGDAPRTLIIMTAPFTAVHNVQTAGRVWRLSSQSHPEIEYVFSDLPIDDWNAKIIERKMKSLGASVGGEVTKLDVPENFTEQETKAIPGLEDIEELDSLASPADDDFEAEESFGATGHKSITRVKPRTTSTAPVEDFKVSARARQILADLGVPVAEKFLSKKYLGLYKLRSKNIRVQSSFDVFTVAHEGTHFLSRHHGIIQDMIDKTSGAAPFQSDQVRKDLSQLYLEYYPGASPNHPLERRMEEGFAMLVEQYLFDPAEMNAKYPALVRDFITPGGLYYHPDTTKLLDAMNSLVDDYARMSPEQRIGARIADGAAVVKKDSGFDAKQRAIYEAVNQYEPLKRAGKMGGVAGTLADPFVHSFTRMALPSIVHSWIKGKNTLVLKRDGNWSQAPGTVKDYLKLIEGKEKEFDILLVARRIVADTNRMEELKKELRRMLRADPDAAKDPAFQQIVEQVKQIHAMLVKDDFKLQDATAVVGKYEKQFTEALDIYDRINKRLVTFAENAGIITPEYAAQMRSSDGYSSWIRNISDELKPQGPGLTGSKNPLSKVRSFKTRTGSNLDIISPTYNQITAIGEVLGKGLENIIWRKVVDLTVKNPEIAKRFEQIETQKAVDNRGRIVYPQDNDPHLIKVWIDGKRAYYKPAPEFMAVAKNLRGKEYDTFANLIRMPSAVFTRLTTSANPIWALGNLTIDQFSATMNTKTGFKAIVDPVKSLVEFLREIRVNKKGVGLSGTGQFEKYLELGGRRQQFSSQYEVSPEDAVAAVLKHKTKVQRAGGVVDLGLSVLELPSNLSEYLTRFSEYRRAKDAGLSDTEAMFLASEVTTPFQLRGHMGGNFGQAWVGSLPYVNAQSQVLYKFARQAAEHPGQVATVAAGLIAAALGSAIAAFRYADDEQKRELFNLEARELAKAIFIPSPLGKKLIRIRVPEEVGALTGLVYMFVGAHYGGNKVRFNDYMDAISSPMPTPLDFGSPSRILPGLVPQALLPTIQTEFNTRTYPEISPIVPETLKRKPVEQQQYTAYTSNVARRIGGVLGISPISVEFWIKNQFGAVGGMFLGKLPQSPITRQEEGFQMAGRAYKNFYRDRDFYDKQYQRLDADNSFSPEEQARIIEQHAMYEDVADTFATMRKELQKTGTLPEELKKRAFDVLIGLDRGKAGMPADADALKQSIGVLTGEKGPQPQRHRMIGERIRGVVESEAYKQLGKEEKRDVLRDVIQAARTEDTEAVKVEKPTRKPTEQAVVEQEVRTAKTKALFEAARNPEYKKLSGWQQKWVRDQVSGMFADLTIESPEVSQDIRAALKEVVPEVSATIPDLIRNAREIEREAIKAAR